MKHLLLNPHQLKRGHIPVVQMKKGHFGGTVHREASTHQRSTSTALTHKSSLKPLKFKF